MLFLTIRKKKRLKSLKIFSKNIATSTISLSPMFYNQPFSELPPDTDFVNVRLIARIPYDPEGFNFGDKFIDLPDDIKALAIVNPAEMLEPIPVLQQNNQNVVRLRNARRNLLVALYHTFDRLCDEGHLGDGIHDTCYTVLIGEGIVDQAILRCEQFERIYVNPYHPLNTSRDLLAYSKRLQGVHNICRILHSTQGDNWIQALDMAFPNFPVHPSVHVFNDPIYLTKILSYVSPDMYFPLGNNSLSLCDKLLSGIGPQLDIFVAMLSFFV